MRNFKKKKLLILGGASVHVKLIKAAQSKGAYVIVTDNVPFDKSPGKRIANECWDFDIFDYDAIEQKSKERHVEGVLSCWLDPCQIPYYEICRRLSLPCYGTEEQFHKMTNKRLFKRMCVENGVGIIKEYSLVDIADDNVDYPIFIKPVDSRGSRGQSVCYNKKEASIGVEKAKSESSDGQIIIEKYIEEPHEIQITYFFVNGSAYLIRTTDSYVGKGNMSKVVLCSVSPSIYTEKLIETDNQRIIDMFKRMGFKNGPIFAQGFYDNGTFRLFDPGLRFPGVDYDLIYEQLFGIDVAYLMVYYAFFGHFPIKRMPNKMYHLKGKRAAVLFPTITAGTIRSIDGFHKIRKDPSVFSCSLRHSIGDKIEWNYNVNQRIAEIDLLSRNTDSLRRDIEKLLSFIEIFDTTNSDMNYDNIEIDRIV